MYLQCRECGLGAGLIRGLCGACAPELHANYAAEREYWHAKFDAFMVETGVDPIMDWDRFEQWCQRT